MDPKMETMAVKSTTEIERAHTMDQGYCLTQGGEDKARNWICPPDIILAINPSSKAGLCVFLRHQIVITSRENYLLTTETEN